MQSDSSFRSSSATVFICRTQSCIPTHIHELIAVPFAIMYPILNMQLQISPLDIEGADDVVRKVDLPAMKDGPLYRLMFPLEEVTEEQQAEIIHWYVRGIIDALNRTTDTLIRICDAEGTPLGFCGWTVEDRPLARRENGPARHLLIPEMLDISAWSSASSNLRKERERALNGRKHVCRKRGILAKSIWNWLTHAAQV